MSLLHPHSFRGRVSLWIGAGAMILTGVLLTVYSLLMSSNLIHYEKHNLRRYARTVLRVLEHQPEEDALATIRNGYDFAAPRHEVAMSIYRRDDAQPVCTLIKQVPVDLDPPAPGDTYRFVWDMHGYEDFLFRLRMDSDHYTLVIRKPFHTEAIERIAVPGALCMLLGITLSLILSAWVSRKVVSPVRLIAANAAEIRRGNLAARIPDTGNHDEIQELIDTLNATFEDLEQNIHRISQFSANAAHELRTPLTALRGHLEVCLRRPRDDAEYREALQTGVDQIAHLQEIVNALLLLARSGHEQWQQDFQDVDLADLAVDAVDHYQNLADERHVHLALRTNGGHRLRGVPTFLRQLIANLLHNAIKFAPADTEVTLAIDADGPALRLCVADHGPGIDPALHERIFELFYQGDASRQEGVGLGLSLVKWIVDLHHGTIQVDSTPGHGATFTVRLPAQTPA